MNLARLGIKENEMEAVTKGWYALIYDLAKKYKWDVTMMEMVTYSSLFILITAMKDKSILNKKIANMIEKIIEQANVERDF